MIFDSDWTVRVMKMRWIEFYGLPGAGKTTLKNVIINEYRRYGGIYTYRELDRKNSGWLYKRLGPFRFFSLRRFRMLLRMAKKGKAGFAFRTLKRVYYVERICCTYRKYADMPGVCIVDQGIVQAVLSVFHDKRIKNADEAGVLFKMILDEFSDSITFVHSMIQPEESLMRVRERNKEGVSRMDEITDDKALLMALTVLKENFEELEPYMKDCDTIDVDMAGDIQKNAELIIPYLRIGSRDAASADK